MLFIAVEMRVRHWGVLVVSIPLGMAIAALARDVSVFPALVSRPIPLASFIPGFLAIGGVYPLLEVMPEFSRAAVRENTPIRALRLLIALGTALGAAALAQVLTGESVLGATAVLLVIGTALACTTAGPYVWLVLCLLALALVYVPQVADVRTIEALKGMTTSVVSAVAMLSVGFLYASRRRPINLSATINNR